MQVNHWSRIVREFPDQLCRWCCNTTLTNQVLPCGEIGLNQLREAYTSGLIPSKGTSNIAGSISVGNMIGLTGEKQVERNPREFPGNVVNGI